MVLPQPECCDSACSQVPVPGPPGDAGAAGAPGTDGTDGINAFTTVANYNPEPQPVMPAEAGTVTVNTTSSTEFMAPGDPVFVEFWGTMFVVSIPSTTSVILQNPEDSGTGAYASNAAPGTSLTAAAKIVPGGIQGVAGSDASAGAPTTASYITQTTEAALASSFSLGSLTTGMLKHTVTLGVSVPSTAAAGTDYLAPAAIGTTVQAFDATLQSLSALGTGANKMVYTTGVDTWAELDISAFVQTLMNDADGQTFLNTLGALAVNQGRVCMEQDIDMNAVADTLIGIPINRYRLDEVIVYRPTTTLDGIIPISLTTATVGLFTGAGGGGVTLAADQSVAALTALTSFKSLTLEAITGTDYRTENSLFFRVGTAQGAASFAKVIIFATVLQ